MDNVQNCDGYVNVPSSQTWEEVCVDMTLETRILKALDSKLDWITGYQCSWISLDPPRNFWDNTLSSYRRFLSNPFQLLSHMQHTHTFRLNVYMSFPCFLQIRQEKPYYIADPEVDSLVSILC
jgi:hypothetical protein